MEQKQVNKINGEYICDIDISVDEWKIILQDENLMNDNYKEWLIRFYNEPEHKSTCKYIGEKYGVSPQSPNGTITNFAKAVQKKLNRFEIVRDNGEPTYWIIPMKGKDLQTGLFEWTLRPELVKAIEFVLIDNNKLKLLISKYKYALKNNIEVALYEEKYKWELINNCVGRSKLDIIEVLRNTNLIHQRFHTGTLKQLIENDSQSFGEILDNLLDESIDLQTRLDMYKQSMIDLCKKYNWKNLPNDERTAASILTCCNPQKYTFYKDSSYKEYCDYLEVKTESAGKKYVHYLSLIQQLKTLVDKDLELTNFIKAQTNGLLQSSLLTAQNIVYTMSKINSFNPVPNIMNKLDEYISLLKANHNLIFTGAPGTGKTHLAKQIACQMRYGKNYDNLSAEEKKDYDDLKNFVQFHPSYDYTDFVEGLRPTQQDDNGNMGFERCDGVFKEFCRKALKNLIDSKKSAEDMQKESTLQETINDFFAEAMDNNTKFNTKTGSEFYIRDVSDTNVSITIPDNKVASEIKVSLTEITELLKNNVSLDNVKDIRVYFNRQFNTQQDSYTFVICNEIKKIKPSKGRNNNSVIVSRKDFIFIIDEINRGEISKIFGELFFSIDPGYRGEAGKVQTQYQNLVKDGDEFKQGFYVPENVYIIGTMNDIDRSVESMDFAMRRRFAWCEITADESAENMNLPEDAKARMKRLNTAISEIEDLNDSYFIGGAYFRKPDNSDNSDKLDFADLWNLKLCGLLKEYLRGTDKADENLKKLKAAYDNEIDSSQDDNDDR